MWAFFIVECGFAAVECYAVKQRSATQDEVRCTAKRYTERNSLNSKPRLRLSDEGDAQFVEQIDRERDQHEGEGVSGGGDDGCEDEDAYKDMTPVTA